MSDKIKLSSTQQISPENTSDGDKFVILAKDGATFFKNRLLDFSDVQSALNIPDVYISQSYQTVRLGDVHGNVGYFDKIVVHTQSIVLDTSGSTKFGDTGDDTHEFTGSVFIDGPEFTHNGYDVLTTNDTGSLAATSSFALSASHADHSDTSQFAFTASDATNAFHADQADIALDALNANQAVSASHAIHADTAEESDFAFSASNAVTAFNASQADIALDALNAVTASYVHWDNVDGKMLSTADSASYVHWDDVDERETTKFELFDLTAGNITAKYITLSEVPRTPHGESVCLDIKGASSQHYGDDFEIHTTFTKRLRWDSLSLDGVLEAGDKLTVKYVIK